MKNIILFLMIVILLIGCSNSDNNNYWQDNDVIISSQDFMIMDSNGNIVGSCNKINETHCIISRLSDNYRFSKEK